MEKDLEEYLKVLNSERCLKKPKEAKMVMDKIHWCLRNCKSQLMLKLLINLIMDENGALFSFIWKTCSDFELISSTTSALKLIECLLEDFKEAMEPYFCKIFHKCLLLVETKFARVKEFSLKILKGLISADRWLRLDLSKVTVKLKKHLKEESKISGTVSEQLFSIVGVLLEKYPESLERDGNRFFLQAIETLWREMNVIKNPSLSKIKGALEAINGYLVNFPVPGSDALRKIYGFIKRLGVLQAEKRAASRLALKIFQNHWKHFSDLAYEDRDHWKNVLSVWIRQSSEDRRCGFHSLTAFYRMITLEIKKGGSNEEFVNNYFFEFARTLKSKESNIFEKRSALLGVKLFVLTDCLKYEKLSEAYQLVEDMQNLDSINIAYLPICIECASAFALKLSESADEQLSWLQRMSVLLIDQYPKIEAEFQPDALLSLEKSFYTLAQSNLNAFETHVEGVLYQGLIRSCSYPTVVDAEVLKEVKDQREENVITHKSYLTLWKYLLNLTTTTVPPTNGCFILKKGVAIKVFDGYVSSLLKIISKLNYELKTGPEAEEVEKPSDLRIFANCVGLYVDLIPMIDSHNLQKWIIKILQCVIHKSYKNPLVAGFYKILSATLRVADVLDFFGEAKEDSKRLVSVFLERVLLKVDQYKEDLQLACLETLLAAPVCLLETFAEKMIPALEMGIRLGRGNFQLLKNIIETLERWNRHLSTNTGNIIMRRILPHFHVFFQSSCFPIEAGGFNDSELLMVQKRFLLFLGSLEIGTSLTLVEPPEGVEEERRVTDKKILYRLPFGDQTCQINLDDLLPRVMELAMSCSDRSTRITACELLYSMVIVVLGNINQVNGSFTAAFRKIMRCCLILGCDSDCLVFQIFEPLMFQITHFFSMRKAAHFTETQDLINILIEYVTIPYDPGARDFAALLMREFTLWTIKQLPPKDIQLASDSLNKILNNIYSLSLHPNHDKRLGAAIIFNKIYPILREEDFIFNAHWFQLFYHFLEGLRMCDELEDVTEFLSAIQHIKRPLMEKSEEFNEASPNRIVPPEFSGGQLCHLVKWTLDLCWDSRTLTRRTAMSLAEELAPLVSDCNSLPAFIRLHLSNKSFRIRLALEKKENDSVKLKRLIAIFDYYTWLINQRVITVEDAFGFKFNETSKKFLIHISCSTEVDFRLDSLKRQGALSFLSYLFALRDKAYFFRIHVWEFLKICIFKPSDYGFDMNDAATAESLSSLLIDLLKFFSIKLTHYEWDQFFEELEWIITVPNLKHITKSRCLCTNHLEFLHGINIVQNSGMWSMFKERLLFIMDGWLIVGKIFDSLFFKKGRNSYAISPEPSCKAYLEGFLKFAFKINSSFENIFRFIENSEIVREEETGKFVRKGEYFLIQFKNVIFEFINTRERELIERIFSNPRGADVNLLIGILLKQRAEDGGTDLGREVLNNWFRFVELKTKKIISEKILLRLAVSASEVFGKSECLSSCPLSEWVYSTLKNEMFVEMHVDKVEGIFSILSLLADFGENGPDNEDLKTALDIFFGNPSAVREFEETESCQRNRTTVAVKGLLRSLKHTGSLIILQVILRLVKFLEKLAKEEEVVSALSVFAESGIPSSRPLSALKLLCDFCFEKRMFAAMRIVRDWFINPLLEKLPNRVIYDFVTENLECLCSLISSKFEIDDMLKLKTDVAKKICASNILKIFIFKMTKEELDGLPKEKRQCIDQLIKSSYDLIPDLKNYNVLLLKRVRSFVCELFNLICSIICARCSDHKIYKLFIFDERGCFLYGAIDKDVEYSLDMDFVEIPKRKKYLTSLRKSVTLERQMSLSKPLQSVKYIQTNTLFSSSLLEDVTKFDLTLSPIRPISFVEGFCPPEPSVNMTVELEGDVFNNHECMATLVGVIHKMTKNKIFPSAGNELPCWLTFFLKVLTMEKQHKNLKLFILKAIYNVQEYVKPYCEKTFPIVLDSICSLFGDTSINYLFVDLIAMLVEWRHIPTCEKSRRQLTQVASIFMSKSDSFRRDIVKSNMETFKMIIEAWKDALFVRDLFCLLLKRLSRSIEKDIENDFSGSDGVTYVNIQVAGILLSNDVLWPQESSKYFFDLILKGIREKNKNKERFAELCGLALDRINRERNEDVKEYERQVRDKIACQPQSRLSLLYAVHKYYPKMVSKFIFDIYASTWNFVDSVSVKNLEMLLSYVSDEENSEDDTLYRNIASFLKDMMKTSDISVHEISLQIADKILGKVEEGKVDMIVGEALKLSRSSHPGVRKWVYEIAKKYYSKENYRLNIGKECKFTLLRGLTDEVKELEDFCVDFWQTFLKCSTPYSKLLQVLQKMYAVEIESDFLNIAVRILLNSSSLDSYSQFVFPNPITHEASYQKRNLLDVRKTSLSGFVSTKSWTNQSLECVASLKSQSHSDLRQTRSSLNFAPTVSENPGVVQKMNLLESNAFEEERTVKNPLRRRFFKSLEKTNFSIKRQQIEKKKYIEEEIEMIGKKKTEVEVLGDYKAGDYPDVQIAHYQILKPLQVLAKKDHQIARQFLTSFYSGLFEFLNEEDRETLLSETNKCFNNIFKSSSIFDPALFGFVFQILLEHSENLDIDCEEFSRAAIASNQLSLGVLAMERIISKKEDVETEAGKRRKLMKNSKDKIWLGLAKLYRSLEESDVLSGIFLDKLKIYGAEKEALRYEIFGNWMEATKHYEAALEMESDSVRSEFYTESYFSCLAKLSDWTALNQCIRTSFNQDLSKIWDSCYVLPWFVKSEMMISLTSGDNRFQMILEDFCKKEGKKKILTANFTEELTVCDMLSGQLERASCKIDRLCLDFLLEWSHVTRWSYKLKATKLTALQTVSELYYVVKTLNEKITSLVEKDIEEGMRRWEKNMPSTLDDLMTWDVKLKYRERLVSEINDINLHKHVAQSKLALAKAALTQDNLHLAREYLIPFREKLPELEEDLKFEYEFCLNLGKLILARSKVNKIGIKAYVDMWKILLDNVSKAIETDSDRSRVHLFRCNIILGKLVSEMLPELSNQMTSDVLDSICSLLESSNSEDVTRDLTSKGLEYFETGKAFLDGLEGFASDQANSYLELSKYILNFSYMNTYSEFEKLTFYLLKSMKLGSAEARDLFGCVLNKSPPVEDEAVFENLLTECDLVPSWMFLAWISQILASLTSILFPFLKVIVFRIAEEYPNAIRYPFRLSKQSQGSSNPKLASLNRKLTEILSSRVYEGFLNSMNYLGSPDLILKHHLKNVLRNFEEDNPNYSQVILDLVNLHEFMYSPAFEGYRGPMFKYWSSFKGAIESLMVLEKEKNLWRGALENIMASLETFRPVSKRTLSVLESYSPWLSKFHSLKMDESLEVPGQYMGRGKPILKSMVTVSSFKSEVLLFDSKCKPIRITIVGNDAVEHKFLVKFGEDLRQDERIQQVFRHFNGKLKESKWTKRFSLDVYSVVPLSFSLGMIQWVDNNMSLRQMVESSLGVEAAAIGKAQAEHLSVLAQSLPVNGPVAAHLIAYEKISRDVAVAKYNQRVRSFPGDLLKKAFWAMSNSPEHFFHLRTNFATSHASMSVTHWLVGIGDRHLDNTLVSTKTGRVLGVDFGYAFGFATQCLTPPELVPFRLTPQILNLVHPLDESGWIKQTMVHCLRRFRRDHFVLLSVLEVFAVEPVMDWLHQAKKSQRSNADGFEEPRPRQQITLVQRKLGGANPVSVFEMDLKTGHSRSKYLPNYLEVLRGTLNTRTSFGETGLTEEEQVECLIDLATDHHILSKTYVGWNPWL